MALTTKIKWTRSTFNPWIGCTKVSPGCDNCYAEALDNKRFSKTLGDACTDKPIVHWGPGAPRHRTADSTWRHPRTWNRYAQWEKRTGRIVEGSAWQGKPGFWPVFCASLADVFDNEVAPELRFDLFRLIADTPDLTWLLLTKRIGNAARMIDMVVHGDPLPNVWIGATVVNQEEADRDIPKLLDTPAAKRFVSYEPALGPVDFAAWLYPDRVRASDAGLHEVHGQPIIDWIIVGGESNQGGAKARPFDLAWARQTVSQCREAGVPCFVKQMGSNAHDGVGGRASRPVQFKDPTGADPAEWPEDLRVQEFPA
jgi:protein gp37